MSVDADGWLQVGMLRFPACVETPDGLLLRLDRPLGNGWVRCFRVDGTKDQIHELGRVRVIPAARFNEAQ